jgi:hypothetical protein
MAAAWRRRAHATARRTVAAMVVAAAMVAGASPLSGGIREAPAATTSMSSPNWAGYAAHRPGTQFTDVRGAWAQPGVSCPNAGTYSSFWIGLDGYLSDFVEQIGTGADCTQVNAPSYYAWYELYPAARVRIAMVIRPGDQLEAEVNSIAAGTTLTLRDVTSGRSFSSMRRGSSGPLTSAEWIAEAPSACSGSSCNVLPLANFGTVAFSLCSAIAGSSSGTINSSAWTADVITMVRSNGTVLAQPWGLTADGASFNVSVR